MKMPWHATPAAPFSEYVTRFLLFGPLPFDEMPRGVTGRELAAVWGIAGECVGPAWLRHETWLRSEAARLAITPRWCGKFFSEALASR